ncbi:MAG: heat-inducible transcription repressor HrcA [Ignavibacteriae bacterium]|nr:heat-inducible transcription repressor HrcA [Ignavibacteriota bacterium]MCB9206046.1 heat-inducible transcription repressor HrcA [Ignavibacteriales bacterium]MCB9209321.1 heat-inducible transcription repressor HrcA [Ignavibacteriales bacterium]MCB9257965.1 heat-inducible transcription repressor HrcA [Ignavibacteriales bacterium]
MFTKELTDREKSILRYVIHQFILTANPVGSRNLSKKYQIGYSPATVRNVMSDLEDSGFLGHPHTSAGRVPTDLGYRFYVNSLMETPQLSPDEVDFIESHFDNLNSETDEILKITSSILSSLTSQLAYVSYPKLGNAILEKLQLVSISRSRLLVVVSIKSGMIRTITLEVEAGFDKKNLSTIQRLLNERLAGLTFKEIKNSINERVKSISNKDLKPVIRVFLESVSDIFNDVKTNDASIITGAKNLLNQPEFTDPKKINSIIELIEDKDIIIHVIDEATSKTQGELSITIGSESNEEKLNDYSVIVKEYKVGQIMGSIGIIGPKRMTYAHEIASVVQMAEVLSKVFIKK